jgi:1-aminocyclopropane-1-carboxylate deaminase/D-cysteine desulfhydrase-like pyridoxal-dependent ACC family enzyme
MAGLRFAAAVMELPYAPTGGRPDWEPTAAGGNVVLDALFEGQLYVYPDGTWDELKEKSKELAQMLTENGEKVHIMPVGGSTPTSVYGLIKGVEEIDRAFDTVIVASSSGSTHAGLAYAYHGTDTQIIGIAADPYDELADEIVGLCAGLDLLLGQDKGITKDEIDYRTEWIGEGYSVPSEEGQAASRLLARTEGIILDPVYTSKAFAGLLALAERGELSGRVLFWHTGGTPAVFGHR